MELNIIITFNITHDRSDLPRLTISSMECMYTYILLSTQ